MPKNRFKAHLLERRLQIGLWSSLCSNIVAELVGYAGFDWVLLDTEHSPNELPGLLSQMQALAAGSASAIVRPAWNDPVLIKRHLDIGAQTLLIPFVQNTEDARRAVAACRYPPEGIRGVTTTGRAARYGRVKNYLRDAGTEICVLVQVETSAALDAIDAIAAVDGVDGVFIGPSDLSASMGRIGEPGHPEVQARIAEAVGKLNEIGQPAGILTAKRDEAERFIEWGCRFVAVGSDIGLLASGADMLASSFKHRQL